MLNRGLYKLMRINRSMCLQKRYTPINLDLPTIPPVIPPGSTTYDGYSSIDFGENAINNHTMHDGWHSERCQMIFNYVVKDFSNRCTSIQSYKTQELGSNMIYRDKFLQYCSAVNADIVFTPYVNAAYSSANEYNNFILAVGSHHENNGTDGDLYDDERHDITLSGSIFLEDSIAVSARRDIPTEFTGSTSYGYGMEFFEDCSIEGLAEQFPNKDIMEAFAEIKSVDGINLISTVHPLFADKRNIGDVIIVRYSGNESTWETTTITGIVDSGHITVSPSITPISNSGIYAWTLHTLGETMWGQAQSWAVPLVAAKLKVIKMTTGADWETVRLAARATAKRNVTNIPEIDNASWDIYRGFGCIHMQDAIDYINNN